MSNAPKNSLRSQPSILPDWIDEKDWLVTLVVLPRDSTKERQIGAEFIAYMLVYAQMTDTRMAALLGDPDADMYELLFSFSSSKNKKQFLRLLKSNEVTTCGDEEILTPHRAEIAAAQPIAEVLPEGVMKQVNLIATMLLSDLLP